MARLIRGLFLKPALSLLDRLLRRDNGNSLILGGPMGWSWQTTLDATHHGSLEGPADAHRHADLANIGADDHHDRDHAARHASGEADAVSLDASQIGSGQFAKERIGVVGGKVSSTTIPPGTAKWVRFATSWVQSGGASSALFEIKWTVSGQHGHSLFYASNSWGSNPVIAVMATSCLGALALTQLRYAWNSYGHFEAYLVNTQPDLDMNVYFHQYTRGYGGFDLLATPIDGEVPGGYSSFTEEVTVGPINMRLRCRTSDPATPADGEIWLRTDL